MTGVQWAGLNKTLIAIVLSPTLGLLLTMLIMLVTSWLGLRATAVGADRTFRILHLFSSATYCVGHGLNDAQKTMGVIAVLLYSTGYLHGDFHVPHWVALSCYVAMGLGTLSGGWKIIETMGIRITKLSQHQGFSASTSGTIMRAFIAVPPSGITDPATVLPVQIFLWSDEVDRAFIEKTSAAIIVLLVFMMMMNALAIYLRNRFEQRW